MARIVKHLEVGDKDRVEVVVDVVVAEVVVDDDVVVVVVAVVVLIVVVVVAWQYAFAAPDCYFHFSSFLCRHHH